MNSGSFGPDVIGGVDGSLRDVYIKDTSVDDWTKLMQDIRDSGMSYIFVAEGDASSLPVNEERVRSAIASTTALLRLPITGDAQLNCHFFCVDEIEFDLDPSGFQHADAFEALKRFMVRVSTAVGKEVTLTPENQAEHVLLRYDPKREQFSKGQQ